MVARFTGASNAAYPGRDELHVAVKNVGSVVSSIKVSGEESSAGRPLLGRFRKLEHNTHPAMREGSSKRRGDFASSPTL